MSDRKFTDDEVIKALEWCENQGVECRKCPLIHTKARCYSEVKKLAAALINRQKAEIERLHSEVKEKTETIDFLKDQAVGWSIDFCNLKAKLNTAKAEAIKEFAERLHERLYSIPTVYNSHFGRMIDTIVKEMTEGGAE